MLSHSLMPSADREKSAKAAVYADLYDHELDDVASALDALDDRV